MARNGVACTTHWNELPMFLTGAIWRNKRDRFTYEFLVGEALKLLAEQPMRPLVLEPLPAPPRDTMS